MFERKHFDSDSESQSFTQKRKKNRKTGKTMSIFFTSDDHFGHANIIKYTGRPFKSTEEMDRTLLLNINAVVTPRDVLYVLGDFAMGQGARNLEHAKRALDAINCKRVHLIAGNHDPKDKSRLEEIGFASVKDYDEVKIEGNRFCLMHYPLLEWNGYYHGAFDLHGHVHNGPEYNIEMREQGIRRYDVGVDANNFFPVKAEDIIRFFE